VKECKIILILITILTILNGVAASMLLLYGINAFWLTLVHNPQKTLRKQLVAQKTRAFSIAGLGSGSKQNSTLLDLPIVTVQLPIFNERYVAQRLLDAVCQLDYPRDRLYIQILDDSIDDTQLILSEIVEEYQNQGFWLDYIHRTDRTGFKAGALQAAMPLVQGNYIAIFDADFIPPAGWLKQTMRHYIDQPDAKIAVVQTRWGHINSEYSLLTKLQSTGIDGHFAIEQQARSNNDYFLNFNGTAGIWNKRSIIESGGWHADTLAEDMDLSYRAQLKGWKVLYDNDIVAPAELPVAMSAFKLQQFRWAKGSIQCAKKLIWQIWQADLSLGVKFQATIHLIGYSTHPLMLLVILLAVPLMLITPREVILSKVSFEMIWGLFTLPAFGPPFLYLKAQSELYPKSWHRRLGRIFLLAILGTGISWSNSRAVFAGLFNKGANFRRTPKFNITGKGDRWISKSYKLPFDFGALIELGLCIYSAYAIYISVQVGWYGMIPFLTIYCVGYGYVGGLTLWQHWQQLRGFRRE
jgi:cellulose synthase/poly-beta-1,6-N-acetylglucosamine synthase-like glycosyltransferase